MRTKRRRYFCTRTAWVSLVNPGAVAVMVADPSLVPCVLPTSMKMVCVTVTFRGSLLVKVTITPPCGAGANNVNGICAVSPRGTDMFDQRLIGPRFDGITQR